VAVSAQGPRGRVAGIPWAVQALHHLEVVEGGASEAKSCGTTAAIYDAAILVAMAALVALLCLG